MTWPAQSPDLNPIENVWQQLKTALEKRSPSARTKGELLVALQEEWAKLQEKNTLAVLIRSMHKHVKQVISSGGMPIKY
jgi:transposase